MAVGLWLVGGYLLEKDDRPDGKDTSGVEALVRVGDAFFGGAILFSIPLLVATGLASLRFRTLPRWLGWLSLVLALAMAIPGIVIGLVVGLPLWTLVVSVVLLRRSAARAV